MQKCCLVECDNDSSKGVSDYCEPHRREKERQLMDDTGFRRWYNDQPYKGERLAFNAWQEAQKQAAKNILGVVLHGLPESASWAHVEFEHWVREKYGI